MCNRSFIDESRSLYIYDAKSGNMRSSGGRRRFESERKTSLFGSEEMKPSRNGRARPQSATHEQPQEQQQQQQQQQHSKPGNSYGAPLINSDLPRNEAYLDQEFREMRMQELDMQNRHSDHSDHSTDHPHYSRFAEKEESRPSASAELDSDDYYQQRNESQNNYYHDDPMSLDPDQAYYDKVGGMAAHEQEMNPPRTPLDIKFGRHGIRKYNQTKTDPFHTGLNNAGDDHAAAMMDQTEKNRLQRPHLYQQTDPMGLKPMSTMAKEKFETYQSFHNIESAPQKSVSSSRRAAINMDGYVCRPPYALDH